MISWFYKIASLPQSPSCPKCGSPMVLRQRKTDGRQFFGCSKFPRCNGIVPYSANFNKQDTQPSQPSQPSQQNETVQQNNIKPQNWFDKNVKRTYFLATFINTGSPIAISKSDNEWIWIDQSGKNGIIQNNNINQEVKSIRDQSNRPYSSENPEELFTIYNSLQTKQNISQENPEEIEKKKQANIIPENKMSFEQKSIEMDFSGSNNSIMIDALAGSGKTTLLKHLSWKFGDPNQKWLYMVFNTKNKVEAKGKFPSYVNVDTTNGFLGKILDNASKKGLIPETKRIKSLEPKGKVSKSDRVPDKSALLVDGQDFYKMMTNFKLTAVLPKESGYNPAEANSARALLRQIRGDFRKAVLTLCDLCKAYAIDPRNKKDLIPKISGVLDKYDIDYDLNEVKERIGKYKGQFQARIIGILNNLLGFDIMSKSFRSEVITSVAWLLNEALPGQSNHKFNYRGNWYRLGDYRDFSDDLWFSAIHANQIDWTNGIPGGYSHVLADEVQDFNECQKIALAHMKGKGSKVVAVGDENQSIYRFRGADASAFKNISGILGSKQHSLSYNFRSKPAIINFSNMNTHVKNLKVGLKIKEEDIVNFLSSNYQKTEEDIKYLNDAGQVLNNNVNPQSLKAAIDSSQLPWPPSLNGEATVDKKEYEDVFNSIQKERESGNKVQTAFISRTNAPLAHAALKLLSQSIPFVIVGKDIANDLINHIEWMFNARVKNDASIVDINDNSSVYDLQNKLSAYLNGEKFQHANKASKRGYLQDLEDTTTALDACIQQYINHAQIAAPNVQDTNFYDDEEPDNTSQQGNTLGQNSIGGFKSWLKEKLGGLDLEGSEKDVLEYDNKVEKDKKNSPIVLTTAHKSKGLEFERVYVLRNDLFPHPKAKRPEDLQQEANGKYVCYTRAMSSLHILKLDGQPGYKK